MHNDFIVCTHVGGQVMKRVRVDKDKEQEIQDAKQEVEQAKQNVRKKEEEFERAKQSVMKREEEYEQAKGAFEKYDQEGSNKHIVKAEERLKIANEHLMIVQKDLSMHYELLLIAKKMQMMVTEQRALENKHQKKSSQTSLIVEPPSLSCAASSVTRSQIDQRKMDGDVYHHWFALAMYDLRANLERLDSYDVTFLNENMSIPKSQMDETIKRWVRQGSSGGHNETYFSAELAVQLDRFLFPCGGGYCLHQMPLEHFNDRPDFCVLRYPSDNAEYDQASFVAVADFKLDDFECATLESYAYALKGSKGCFYPLRLIFPCTRYKVKLILLVPHYKQFLSIDVYESDGHLTHEKLRIFLCMLYVGVHYLLMHPIQVTESSLCPQQHLGLHSFLTKGCYNASRLLTDKENFYVYKMFDSTKNKPQLEVVRLVLSEAEVQSLSLDGRYSFLKYLYRSNFHENPTRLQFHTVLTQLDRIHHHGYVHSDIRRENIVFGHGKEAWIIDFDLADKEDTYYPDNYNHYIDERHPDAARSKQRKKIHDVFSLNNIITGCGFPGILDQYCKGRTLLQIANDSFM